MPLMLLPGKANLFEICCCGKFLRLAKKHGTHSGATSFQSFSGALHVAHPKISCMEPVCVKKSYSTIVLGDISGNGYQMNPRRGQKL